VNGVAIFDDMEITAYPDSNSTLIFDVLIADIDDVEQIVSFRACESGEELSKISNNQATCVRCGLGTYSFDPAVPCKQCPEHADCPGGNVLNLAADFWRVDNISATILRCPVQGLCLGGQNVSEQCAVG
jgi:hypothetical protein